MQVFARVCDSLVFNAKIAARNAILILEPPILPGFHFEPQVLNPSDLYP